MQYRFIILNANKYARHPYQDTNYIKANHCQKNKTLLPHKHSLYCKHSSVQPGELHVQHLHKVLDVHHPHLTPNFIFHLCQQKRVGMGHDRTLLQPYMGRSDFMNTVKGLLDFRVSDATMC